MVGAGKAGVVGWKATPYSLPDGQRFRNSSLFDAQGFFTKSLEDAIYIAEGFAEEGADIVGMTAPKGDGVIRIGAVRQWGGFSKHAKEEIETVVGLLQKCDQIEVVDLEHRMLGDLLDPSEFLSKSITDEMLALQKEFCGKTDPFPEYGHMYHYSNAYLLGTGKTAKAIENVGHAKRYEKFIQKLFVDAKIDYIVTPIAPQGSTTPKGVSSNMDFAVPFSLARMPSVALPFGRLSATSRTPLAVQIVAPAHCDLQLLHAARVIEEVMKPLKDPGLTPLWELPPFDILQNSVVLPQGKKKKKSRKQ